MIIASRGYVKPRLDTVVDSHERESMDVYDNPYELFSDRKTTAEAKSRKYSYETLKYKWDSTFPRD